MVDIREIQAYAYFFFTFFLVVILYSYTYHLYKSEKDGVRNYEKYGELALNDELTDAPLEEYKKVEKEEDKKGEG